jgi:hypothetical protein
MWRIGTDARMDGSGDCPAFAITDLFLLDESGDVPRRLARFLMKSCTQSRRAARNRSSSSAAQDQRILSQWLHSERVLEYVQALERYTAYSVHTSRGRTYDLAKMYASINQEYFAGSLSQPELCWSRRQAFRRTGTYDLIRNCITISSALDAPDVPDYVVRFVLYHEMLHQEARLALMQDTNEKRDIHGKTFRTAERKFPQYEEASAYLETLARKKRNTYC